MLRVETNISIIAASVPTLRPLTEYLRRIKKPQTTPYINRDTKQRLSSNKYPKQHDYEKGLAPSNDAILPAVHTRTKINRSDDGMSLYEMSEFLSSSER